MTLFALVSTASLGVPRGSHAQQTAQPAASASAPPDASSAQPSEAPAEQRWCAPGLPALAHDVCYHEPSHPDAQHRTLVIFLHGVVQPGTTWQWAQQTGIARAADQNGFTVIMPRARRGYGPGNMHDWWTWPTSVAAQHQVEDDVVSEWMQAKQTLEARAGRPFDRVYVFGFSSGAYYGASLALRGRLEVDGYAVFAGGSAPDGAPRWAAHVRPRPPIYVGYGEKDATAKRDTRRLANALRALHWPHRYVGHRNVGHSMTDSQIREALALFESRSPTLHAERAAGEEPSARPSPARPARSKPAPSRRRRHPGH